MPKILILLTLISSAGVYAAEPFVDTKISSENVSQSLHMLTGAGGNIGDSTGEDGVLIIDDQYEPLAKRIAATIGDIKNTPMRYVVNTHYHGDHTGSNAYFHEVRDSTIFAHDNVRKRLVDKADHKHSSLPVVTFQQGITFHFNGETIKVMHLPAGHTDGDSAIWFEKANVLHAGDLFFEGRFPYIDLNGGGTVAGYISNAQTLIDMTNEDTKIIPGHGALANKADYKKALDMVRQTAAIIAKEKAEGESLENLIKEGLGDKWKVWGWEFITEEKWITTLYKGQ
jgi:glyoxylase-like metal-dependent hydrolase (beta-lactamase superfamily II)